ncbi:hypothetical protein QQS21_008131 [Conoideocrella luteorostrata]|uniref:C2H2-type domain-containing protein n=1 Tax=Conoideocrella luteorostrata TaxID=1105319 RepID=A0AAJ0FRP6_9HYPO|nr:hypothetical protein QQS21_008131 [Conoideocrella luteorostrata]
MSSKEIVWPPKGSSPQKRRSRLEVIKESFAEDDVLYCLHPGCYSRGFRNFGELDEHYKVAHLPPDDKPARGSGYGSRVNETADPFDQLNVLMESLQTESAVEVEKKQDLERKRMLRMQRKREKKSDTPDALKR